MYKPLQMASVLASIIVLLTACDSKSGDASEPLITGAVPTTESEAARFLSQTTFGPTKVEIDFVSTYGYEIWVDQQMSLPGTLMIPDLETKIQQAGIPLWAAKKIIMSGADNSFQMSGIKPLYMLRISCGSELLLH